MNIYSRSSADPPEEEPLTGLLNEAVRQIRNEPEAPEALERAMVKARNLQRPFVLSGVKISSHMMIASSLVVLLVVGAFVAVWLTPPANVWAQMLTAVSDKPWIHARTVAPDGTKIDIWVSTCGDLTARRYGQMVEYDDYRKGVRYHYDPITDQVSVSQIELPAQQSKEKLRLVRDVFQGIFPQQSNLAAQVNDTSPKQGNADFFSRKQIEYVLTLERGIKRTRLVFGVDPFTRLPASMRVFRTGRQESYMTFRFGFPQEGPQDVFAFALGVPPTAKIVGEIPNDQEPKGEIDGV